jgi:DNA-directed RNA polymerase subunit F
MSDKDNPDFSDNIDQVKFNLVCNDIMDKGMTRSQALKAHGMTVAVFRRVQDQSPENANKFRIAMQELAVHYFEELLQITSDTSVRWQERQARINVLLKLIPALNRDLFSVTAPPKNEKEEEKTDELSDLLKRIQDGNINKG